MDEDAFLQLLRIVEPQRFIDDVVGALDEVYRFNADRREPDMGDDEQWFGFSVYRNGWFRIEERLAQLVGVRTGRPNNSLLISVDGGVRFRVYRGGNDERYDIYSYDWNTGTRTKLSLCENNTRQLSLFDGEAPEDRDLVWMLDELAIVHAGNADDGLTGVWVGAPVSEASDGSQWAWVLQLYAHGGEPEGTRITDTNSLQRFSDAPEPDLDLGLRSDEDGEAAR